jgi:hypothetical protein
MTREEQIETAWVGKYFQSNHCYDEKSFKEGAKWADEHPNGKLVYTKQELMDMGFGFDLNGNINTPQEIEERSKKYINYRKNKWINKACDWLDKVNADRYMDSGIFQMYDLISDLRKYLEE